MYTRRSQIVTFNSLGPLLEVCRMRSYAFPYSINSFHSIRNLSTATERSDFNNASDENVAENLLDDSNFNRNDRYHGRNLGGVEHTQNPNRVYRESLNGLVGNFSTESSVSHSAFVGYKRSVGNQSDYNYGNQNNQFTSVILDGVEQNQNLSGFHCQNVDLDGHNDGRVMGISQKSCGGMSQQNPRGQFFSTKMENCRTHVGEIPVNNTGMTQPSSNTAGMPNQNGWVSYSNQGGCKENRSQSQSGEKKISYGCQAPSNMDSNETSFDLSQGSPPERKIEDLDELIKEGKLKEAVELLKILNQDGVQVDVPRYIALMKSCGDNKALDEAKSAHALLLKSMADIDMRLSNNILEMYCKCGSLEDMFALFDQMTTRNLTSWDIMISGLAKNGLGEGAIELFGEFKRSGLKPDGQMFIGVISACSVICDTVEGMLHFESMTKDYGILPSMEHYVSIVDMFGTAGYLDQALEFIETMPIEPQVDTWETLMKFCRIHGDVELGDRCADLIQHLDPSCLNKQSKEGLIPINIAGIEKEQAKKKLSGKCLSDIKGMFHQHKAGDRSHPEHEKYYTMLWGLKQQMKDAGYSPVTKYALHDVDVESKEEALMAHSERLAAAQGFMTSPPRSQLRIFKNLRVCVDCHNALKIISKIVGRQIIARDSKRFHHFENGSCNCNDFW